MTSRKGRSPQPISPSDSAGQRTATGWISADQPFQDHRRERPRADRGELDDLDANHSHVERIAGPSGEVAASLRFPISLPGGQPRDSGAVEWFSFRDGRVVGIRAAYTDPAVFAASFAEPLTDVDPGRRATAGPKPATTS